MTDDREQLRAVGHGVLALVNASILLAIIAVVLSNGSQAPQLIQSFFGLLSWLVGQVVTPVSGGVTVPLSATPQAAGALGAVSTQSGASAATTGTTGSGTGDAPLYNIIRNGIVTGYSRDPTYTGQQPTSGNVLGLPPAAGQ